MPPDDPEDLDPGQAGERTRLAWTRTAVAFAAVGAVMLKTQLAAGLMALAVTPVIWALGRVAAHDGGPGPRSRQLLLITASVVAISALAMAAAFLGRAPASFRQLLPHG